MTLNFEQKSAIAALLRVVFDVELFEQDDTDDEWYHTTGNTINLESIHAVDYEELKRLHEILNL